LQGQDYSNTFVCIYKYIKVEGPNLGRIDMVGSEINDIDFAYCNGSVCNKIGSECFIPFLIFILHLVDFYMHQYMCMYIFYNLVAAKEVVDLSKRLAQRPIKT
jgi:hypothetical protein